MFAEMLGRPRALSFLREIWSMSKSLSDSQMAMWKSVVALVHADGKKHYDEITFLKDRFSKLPATEEQKQDLLSSIDDEKLSIDDEFKKITTPADRGQLIYYARLLFWSDGDFAIQEKQIFETLSTEVLSQTDLKKAMKDIDQVVKDFEAWEIQRREDQPIHRKIINAIIFWQDLDKLE